MEKTETTSLGRLKYYSQIDYKVRPLGRLQDYECRENYKGRETTWFGRLQGGYVDKLGIQVMDYQDRETIILTTSKHILCSTTGNKIYQLDQSLYFGR